MRLEAGEARLQPFTKACRSSRSVQLPFRVMRLSWCNCRLKAHHSCSASQLAGEARLQPFKKAFKRRVRGVQEAQGVRASAAAGAGDQEDDLSR
jgi:hypothetical protein